MYKHEGSRAPVQSIPDLLWEKWVLGEASLDEVRRIEAETTAEERSLKRSELTASCETILRDHPAETVVSAIRWQERQQSLRVRSDRRRLFWLAIPAASTCALAVALWVAGPFRPETSEPSSDPVSQGALESEPRHPNQNGASEAGSAMTSADQPLEEARVKGDPRLLLFRQEAHSATELKDRDSAKPGDRIQVMILASGAKHGVVLSKDGKGNVILHFPESETGSTALQQGDAFALPRSYELDDAPSFERFYLITSKDPLSAQALRLAIEKAGPDGRPQLEAAMRLWTLTLLKGSN